MPGEGQINTRLATAQAKRKAKRIKPTPVEQYTKLPEPQRRAQLASKGVLTNAAAKQIKQVHAKRVTQLKTSPAARQRLADRERGDAALAQLVASMPPPVAPLEHVRPKSGFNPGGIFGGVGKAGDPETEYQAHQRRQMRQMTALAPAIKILEQTTRPLHAVAGATNAALHGQNVPKAALRGIENKDKTTFGDVLKGVGAPRFVQTAAGLTADIVLDPVTWATAGTGSLAAKAASDAAKRVGEKAIAAGMTTEGARTVAARAAKIAAESASGQKGLVVRFAGKELPGVRKATAKVVTKTRAAATVAAEKPGGRTVAAKATRVGQGVKNVVREVRPTIAPAGADQAQFVGARRAARRSRATVNQSDRMAQAQARGLQAAIPAADYAKVIDALETGKLGALTDPQLRKAAVRLRSDYRHANRVRRQSGLPESSIANYFPHAREDALHAGLGITQEGVAATAKPKGYGMGGRTLAKPGSAKKRLGTQPISVQNPERVAEGLSPFSTNIPLVHLNSQAETARIAAKSGFLRDLAATGRKATPGMMIHPGEQLYHLGFDNKKFGLHPVKDTQLGKKSGQYVVLNKKVETDATRAASPAQSEGAIVGGLDRATGLWKRLATSTPGFHIRNLIGDLQMGYLAQPGHRLPGNLATSAKVLRHLSAKEAAARHVSLAPARSTATIKVAGARMPVEDFVRLAQEHGAARSGYIGRELADLAASGGRQGGKIRGAGNKATAFLGRAAQNREDWARLATFKFGLDQGLSPAEAADLVANTHIDYGDITKFERDVARRVAPFYTFSARALPIHAKALVTKPGKFAAYEKLREESARALGLTTDEFDQQLSQYQQRAAPIAIGGNALSAGLPLTTINELPTGITPKHVAAYADEIAQFVIGLANPAIKVPLELYTNKNFNLRSDIQSERAPLVPAPSYVARWPASMRKKLGIVPGLVDKKTGKTTWGWPGKVDYIVKQAPGPIYLLNQLLTPGGSKLPGAGGAATALSGIKVTPRDAVSKRIGDLYDQAAKVSERMAGLRQREIDAKSGSAEYAELAAQAKLIDAMINQMSTARGDVKPLKARRVAGSGGSLWGGGAGAAPAGGLWGGGAASHSGGLWG